MYQNFIPLIYIASIITLFLSVIEIYYLIYIKHYKHNAEKVIITCIQHNLKVGDYVHMKGVKLYVIETALNSFTLSRKQTYHNGYQPKRNSQIDPVPPKGGSGIASNKNTRKQG